MSVAGMPSSVLSAEVSEPRVVPTLICSIILQAPGPPVALADPLPHSPQPYFDYVLGLGALHLSSGIWVCNSQHRLLDDPSAALLQVSFIPVFVFRPTPKCHDFPYLSLQEVVNRRTCK